LEDGSQSEGLQGAVSSNLSVVFLNFFSHLYIADLLTFSSFAIDVMVLSGDDNIFLTIFSWNSKVC
jgi:hypothetical protein